MTSARYLVGDVHKMLATLEPASVDLVLTSPPFLALRSYLPADHPDKQHEIGSEPTPGAFIDVLLDVVEACERVLAPHGSMCIELGDTYSGSGGAGWDRWTDLTQRGHATVGGLHEIPKAGDGWPLDKSLCLIPELFRISLVYGHNPLTGRQTRRWRARNVIRWCRPNPPVGALGDKYRPATTDMVVITRNRDRYFDLDAVRNNDVREPSARAPEPKALEHERLGNHGKGMPAAGDYHANGGAPPLDWWKISTEPYAGAHYATWPTKLLETPIDSMTPLKVCRTCGKPSQRITSEPEYIKPDGTRHQHVAGFEDPVLKRQNVTGKDNGNYTAVRETLGWSDCGHNTWRTGLVLDPFAGSGTTLAVATGHGRDAIGIDLDESNAALALDRVGPLLLEVIDGRQSPRAAG